MEILKALQIFELNSAEFYVKSNVEKTKVIKKIYKKKILIFHPDKNNNDSNFTRIATELNEAYNILLHEYSQDFESEKILIEILKSYTSTGDKRKDARIKEYGTKLYNFFMK